MYSQPKNQPHLVVVLLLVAVVVAVGLLLLNSDGPMGGSLVRASYDSLHRLRGTDERAISDSPVVVVYLDLDSFHALGRDPLQPLPRSLHGELVSRLKQAGARAVVFDIVFAEPGADAASDVSFATEIKQSGGITFLAGEVDDDRSHVTSGEKTWARMQRVLSPLELFRTNAAGWGVAAHIIDDDYVVRRHLAGFEAQDQPSLTWAVARGLELPVQQDSVRDANGRWLRYYGPALVLPNVSYSAVLGGAGVPDDFFKGKIVMVGARPMTDTFGARRDEFRNPFHSFGNRKLFMPGVEVHATAMMNLLRGDWLRRAALAIEVGVLLVVAVLAGVGLLWLRPVTATIAAVAGAGAAMVAARAVFAEGVWFPWLVVAAVQIPCALFGSWLYQFQNWFLMRRRMEAAKKIADAKIREQAALIDKAHDAILVQSLDGKILHANPSAAKLFGRAASGPARSAGRRELAGAETGAPSLQELFSTDPDAAERARAAALKDGEWNGELKLQARDGRIVVVASRWTLIRDDVGQPSALLMLNSDITEQKILEQQFLRTQRMNTIGTLAGGMAHDLNNALAPILMGAQLLRRKAADQESREMLTLMETSTQRGADMVRQVLLFARGRGGEFERLAAGPLVKELEKMIRETFPKNISVTSFIPDDLWPVRGNLTQLHQVLLNLSVNARDAMPGGGRITFVADNVELTASELAQLTANSPDPRPQTPDPRFVSISVTDTGTGMPPEVRAKIFDPFFTTKGEGKGTGIGLATVMRIIQAHAGFLRLDSEPGKGTTFEVLLPRAEAVEALATTPDTELPRGNGELVLIADDERAIRELVGAELTAFGYRVLMAADGAEAVALFKQHADEVALLVTDISMPVMSGLEAIAGMRELRPGLPVILTSGEAVDSAPANGSVLGKPFTLEELLCAVKARLR